MDLGSRTNSNRIARKTDMVDFIITASRCDGWVIRIMKEARN